MNSVQIGSLEFFDWDVDISHDPDCLCDAFVLRAFVVEYPAKMTLEMNRRKEMVSVPVGREATDEECEALTEYLHECGWMATEGLECAMSAAYDHAMSAYYG